MWVSHSVLSVSRLGTDVQRNQSTMNILRPHRYCDLSHLAVWLELKRLERCNLKFSLSSDIKEKVDCERALSLAS